MDASVDALLLLEDLLLDSAQWCLANAALARMALAPAERPTLEPPSDRPSFQRLVKDALVLGQKQDRIRKDDDPNFMALVLLGVYGQAMLTVLAGRPCSAEEIRHIIRIVVEGIGQRPGQ